VRFLLLIRLCRDLLRLGSDSIPELANLRVGYLEKRSAELDRLEFALDAGEYATIATIGHNLKGTGGAYGFAELTNLGRALEAAAKSEDARAVSESPGRMQAYVSAAQPFA
jgi:HPt (histidine-containing phosphotransfer) domain-containing protein